MELFNAEREEEKDEGGHFEGFSLQKPFQEKSLLLSKQQNQWESLKQMGACSSLGLREFFVEQSKGFSKGGESGRLLCLRLPLEDRKLLAEISDTLLKELSSGLVVLLGVENKEGIDTENQTGAEETRRIGGVKGSGIKEETREIAKGIRSASREGDRKFPVLVSLSKNFEKILSAGEILKKTIAPLCKGQGGGRAGFAQGSIRRPQAFPQVEKDLMRMSAKS